MTKKMITMLLAAAMLLPATGCTPSDTAENSSSSVTTEELQVLQDENEKLKQELAELKGEASSEEQDVEASDSDSDADDDDVSFSQTSTPATNNNSSASANTQAPAANNNSSSAAASKPNNQAAKPQAEKPAANNTQTAAKPQTPAPQKTSTGKGPLAKYTVRVKDKTTPAVDVRGRIHEGEAAYVFLSESGEVLGAVPDSNIPLILQQEGLTQAEDDEQKSWFVENFNIYRGLDGGSYEGGSGSTGGGSTSSSEIDIEEFRQEVIRLTNKERKKAGLEPYETHDTAMEFAQIRAEELAVKYSHTRPNGDSTGDYGQYTFGENIAYGQKTPEEVVGDWMASPGHRSAIMSSEDEYFGVGVYKSGGTIYWTQEFIWWDSEG